MLPLLDWYQAHARDLPWRAPDRTPWGVLISEVMLQQTPVTRVVPIWQLWIERWPTPAELADAGLDEVLRAWGTLGYPRRARRLREAAVVLLDQYDGSVPDDEVSLRALPGVGSYTAAAVVSFAFGRRAVVLDTNIRRVLARSVGGEALPPPSLTSAERHRADALLPHDEPSSAHGTDPASPAARISAAWMELGATICTTRSPQCERCPLSDTCAWLDRGSPDDAYAHRRRSQPWHGTDRQARGRVLAAAREHVSVQLADLIWPDRVQLQRCVDTLIADGLIVCPRPGELRLPN